MRRPRRSYWRALRLGVAAIGIVLVGTGFTQTDPTHRFLGIFFGLVLLLIGLVTDLTSDTISRLRARRKTCPMCAEKVPSAAQICRYCGHAFAGP
jgi:hypothetical protein